MFLLDDKLKNFYDMEAKKIEKEQEKARKTVRGYLDLDFKEKYNLKNNDIKEKINKYLTKKEEELKKIHDDRQLKKTLTKWLKILSKSGLNWEEIEINENVIKIYNFKGE